jgi:hypothetical protein
MNKRALPVFPFTHLQLDDWQSRGLGDQGVSVETQEFGRRDLEAVLHAEDVIGCKEYIDILATLREAGETWSALKKKRPIASKYLPLVPFFFIVFSGSHK